MNTPRAVVAVLVALGLVVIVGGASALAFDDGLQYPDEWDPRVEELAAVTEELRGLEFEHPVSVYFLTEDEYSDLATGAAEGEPTAEEQDEAAKQVAMLRAIGVVEGDVDLLSSSDTIADSGTLAYYDPLSDVINVRGEELTPGRRVTLVHELTHALQDQHFGVESLVQNPDSEASSAAAVIEGDASNVEQAYVETELTDDEVAEYEEETAGSIEESELDLGEVPGFLTTSYSVPYYFGPTFVGLFGTDAASGSLDASLVDGLLERTPLTTGHLFDPFAQLDGVSVANVDPPELGTDPAFDEDTFGAVGLFGMLAEHVDPITAMDAVDGWRGDAFRADTASDDPASDDPMCIAADVVMATDDDAAELAAALEAWRSAMPAEAGATVERDGLVVSFESCDPGPDVEIGVEDAFADALAFPVGRLQIAYGQLLGGLDLDTSLCVGDLVVREFDLEDLVAVELTPELEERLTEAVTSALTECAAPR